MNTKIVQKCGCYEDDCVEILGLEVPLYACFTCGYAGVTPSGADNPHEDEVHVHELLAEVKRLRSLAYTKEAIVTIDDWDKSGPCVTVYLEGCEYVGTLRLYKDENGKVIE